MKEQNLPKKQTLLEFGEELERAFTKYGFTVSEGQLLTSPTGRGTKLQVTMVPKSANKQTSTLKEKSD